MIIVRNGSLIFLFFLLISTRLISCRIRISNDPVVPISIYTLYSSKFQVKDLLDSIVNRNPSLTYRKLTEYIDTFILEKTFSLVHKTNSDSTEYFFYFSGDVKEWLTDTDSTVLVLRDLKINEDAYGGEEFKQLPGKTKEKYLGFFKNNIIDNVTKLIAIAPKYQIQIIDTTKKERIEGTGVVCKGVSRCDTLFIKYLDGQMYTGIKKNDIDSIDHGP